MDVIEPELVWVDGRCYRFFESNAWAQCRELNPYEEDLYELEDNSDEEQDYAGDIEIVSASFGKLKHTVHIPKAFYPFIIGSKGATRKRLQDDTKTNITIPRLGEDGDITITGRDKKCIINARHQIDLIVASSRKKIEGTHIISIPLNDESVIANYNKFKWDVLNNFGKNTRGITEEVFQKPEKLHLTITLLTLLDNEERQKAIETLYKCKEEIIKPIINKNGPIKLKIQGLEIMNDDPAEANVLYSEIIDLSGHLQKMCNDILACFATTGLMTRQNENVKIHMTVMNSKFTVEHTTKFKGKYPTFDASKILKEHKFTSLGEVTLKSMHLSQRHAYGEDGYYVATEKISLLE